MDYNTRRAAASQNFGGGGGSGISVNPIGFLTVGPNAEVQLIPVHTAASADTVEEVLRFLDRAPDWIAKIKNSLQ